MTSTTGLTHKTIGQPRTLKAWRLLWEGGCAIWSDRIQNCLRKKAIWTSLFLEAIRVLLFDLLNGKRSFSFYFPALNDLRKRFQVQCYSFFYELVGYLSEFVTPQDTSKYFVVQVCKCLLSSIPKPKIPLKTQTHKFKLVSTCATRYNTTQHKYANKFLVILHPFQLHAKIKSGLLHLKRNISCT